MVAEAKPHGRHSKTTNAWLNRTPRMSEAHALMRAAECERDRLLALVLWSTGCRISEGIQLRACDVLAEDSALRLRNLKQSDKRAEKNVVVSAAVIAELQNWIASEGLQPADYVFAGRFPGTHLGSRQARNVVYKLGRAANVLLLSPRDDTLRPLWPHSLRHGCCTHLLRSGVDLLVAAEQLGHSNIANTRRYTHLLIEDRRKALAAVKM